MTDQYLLSHEWLAEDLPTLTVARKGLPADAPLVIVVHGLGGRKERMLPGLYALAGTGCRAAAFDVQQHGERPDASGREARVQADFFGATNAMIDGTVSDISRLLDALQPRRAAIHGISLGGYIAFAALLAEPRLQVASVALGSPDWLGPLRRYGLGPGMPVYDLAASINPLGLLPSYLPPRPLLMLHGTLDEVVSADGVIALEESLRPFYAAHPERLHLELYAGLGHEYTDDMQRRTVEWMARFLVGEGGEALG